MILFGLDFKKTKSIVTLPSVDSNSKVIFGTKCKSDAKGALKTNWTNKGEYVFGKPILVGDYKSNNLAYGVGENTGNAYLLQGGVVYTAKTQILAKDVALQFLSAFSEPDGKSLLSNFNVTLSFDEKEDSLTITKKKKAAGTTDVIVVFLDPNHASFKVAVTKKLLKTIGSALKLQHGANNETKLEKLIVGLFDFSDSFCLFERCESLNDLINIYGKGSIQQGASSIYNIPVDNNRSVVGYVLGDESYPLSETVLFSTHSEDADSDSLSESDFDFGVDYKSRKWS